MKEVDTRRGNSGAAWQPSCQQLSEQAEVVQKALFVVKNLELRCSEVHLTRTLELRCSEVHLISSILNPVCMRCNIFALFKTRKPENEVH